MSSAFCTGLLGRELVDDLRQAHAPFDRGIVFERQDRSSAKPKLTRDMPLEDTVRGAQPLERTLALLDDARAAIGDDAPIPCDEEGTRR